MTPIEIEAFNAGVRAALDHARYAAVIGGRSKLVTDAGSVRHCFAQ